MAREKGGTIRGASKVQKVEATELIRHQSHDTPEAPYHHLPQAGLYPQPQESWPRIQEQLCQAMATLEVGQSKMFLLGPH